MPDSRVSSEPVVSMPAYTAASDERTTALIDEFVARSRELNGREIVERAAWNTCATADAIRHFAYGTSDGNPLWLDREYARATSHGGLLAPPAFLCSVLYPFLHGAPVNVPLSSLIGKITMEWHRPIREGDSLRASSRQRDVTDSFDRRGRRLILIDAETCYWNGRDELVATALGTMARIARPDGDMFLDREVSRYDDEERAAIRHAVESERRAGERTRTADDVWVGQALPVFVRGPLAVGDLVCWQAAIGPSYRAGSLGYQDMLHAPHHVAINPVTGWPVKYSQQHEDFLMAAQRGMPAPFDNSLMRFAWIAPMLTDWAGDEGVLARLSIQTDAPLLYGDTTWYRGIVTRKRPAEGRDGAVVTVKIAGVNQLGQTTTSGEADVILPARRRGQVGVSRAARSQDVNVLDLMRAQVESRPDAVAVECAGRSLTYAELDRRAASVAGGLMSLGAATGIPVALALERNLDAVVVIVAALKAGCPYLPLDAALPAEKLRHMLARTRPAVVLASSRHLARLQESVDPSTADGCRVVALEPLLADVSDGQAHLDPVVHEDALAYLMPTSGTTTAPRIVGVSHASLGRYLRPLPEALGTHERDVFVHTAAFTFSASVRQLLLPITSGARLVIAEDEQRFDPIALWRLLKARGVTVWDTVPSIWSTCIDTLSLLPEGERAELLNDRLRLVLTTGERLPWTLPRHWRDELGHSAQCINLYSQTETAGTVCVYRVPERIDNETGSVPLGEPLPFARVELLDEGLRPVADGEVGELCISGSRLASGYVGQSDLTSERFGLRPFRHEGFYRTGDLARRRHGVLEFVGRRDDRVKIRGQRVDLKEVEEALRTVAGITDAVVAVDERDRSLPRLVAHVVMQRGTTVNPAGILGHLRRVLPDAALPAAFVPLQQIPRNQAGKVDRTALSPPETPAMPPVLEDETPGASLAGRIERVFAEALELRQVDHDDNFFDLGGNSLMATVVITRLRTAFEVPIPMVRFFEDPTVAAMAGVIEELLLADVEALTEEEAARLLGEDAPL